MEKRVINGKEFNLVWADEFDGKALDKWRDRILGYGYAGLVPSGRRRLSGRRGAHGPGLGAYPKAKVLELVKTQGEKDKLLSEEKRDHIPTVSQIMTKDAFLYGYHELRFKLPLIPGPGLFLVFFGNKGTVDEVEIDVIEQQLSTRARSSTTRPRPSTGIACRPTPPPANRTTVRLHEKEHDLEDTQSHFHRRPAAYSAGRALRR